MLERYGLFSSTISVIHRSIQRIEADEMERYGLKGAFAQYLTVLSGCEEGMTLSQLSEYCMKDKAAVSRAIAEMEKKNLVNREADGGNSYRATLTLTKKGKEAAQFVQQKAVSAVELAGRELRDEDRKTLYTALGLISKNLRDICVNGLPETLD